MVFSKFNYQTIAEIIIYCQCCLPYNLSCMNYNKLYYAQLDSCSSNNVVGILMIIFKCIILVKLNLQSATIILFQMWIRPGTGSTQPCEDNWVATRLRSSGSDYESQHY